MFCRDEEEIGRHKTKYFTCFSSKGKRGTVQCLCKACNTTLHSAYAGKVPSKLLQGRETLIFLLFDILVFTWTFALIKDLEQSAGIFLFPLKLIFSQGTFRHSTKMGPALLVTSGTDCLCSTSQMGWTAAHTFPRLLSLFLSPFRSLFLSLCLYLSVAPSAPHPPASLPWGQTEEPRSLGSRTAY